LSHALRIRLAAPACTELFDPAFDALDANNENPRQIANDCCQGSKSSWHAQRSDVAQTGCMRMHSQRPYRTSAEAAYASFGAPEPNVMHAETRGRDVGSAKSGFRPTIGGLAAPVRKRSAPRCGTLFSRAPNA
jgi:hypothetical protein